MDGIASGVTLIARPSFDRACSFVPSEYVQAWEWFLREEQRGGLWDKLPHRTNADSPQYPLRLTIDSELFPVSRDSGIFWPGRGRVKHPREKTFALSVHNSKRGAYPDVPRRSILRTARGCSSTRRKVLQSKTGATRTTTKR